MKAENLLEGIPAEVSEELLTTIHCGEGLRIERIVSQGQSQDRPACPAATANSPASSPF
jgi:hypothetical protein